MVGREESKRERYMRLLCEKTRELGRKVTSAEVAADSRLPAPNDYAFYMRSFDEAAEDAWLTVQREMRASNSPVAAVSSAPSESEAKVVVTEESATPEMYQAVLEQALALCESLQRVPRKSAVWRAKINLGQMTRVLGKNDFQRALRVVQNAWDERHPELKRDSSDILSLEELDWTKDDWLRWLQSLGRDDYGSTGFWSALKNHEPQYQRILQVFGNWSNALALLKKLPRSEETNTEPTVQSAQAAVTSQYDTEILKGILRKMTEKLGFVPGLIDYNKLSLEFDAPSYPEIKRLVGKYTLWPEILGEPWKSMKPPEGPKRSERVSVPLEPLGPEQSEMKEEKRMVEVEEKREVAEEKTEPMREPERKLKKARVVMTEAEMREFVVQTIDALGAKVSSRQYEDYIAEYGGPCMAVLAKRGLGLRNWPQIAAEEEAKRAAELEIKTVVEEPKWAGESEVEAKKTVEIAIEEEAKKVQSEPEVQRSPEVQNEPIVQSTEETQSESGGQSKTTAQGVDLAKILQVMIHGIDATVTLGDLEIQMRLDFGSKR